MIDYQIAKKILDASAVQDEWQWYHSRELEDRIIEVQNGPGRAWYHPNGLITLFPTGGGKSPPSVVDAWPEGVLSQCYLGPYKEYAVITGDDGVTRYYVMPELGYQYGKPMEENKKYGFMLMPHPDKLYMPVKALPDYDLRIDRKLKNESWSKWKDYLEFADVMWDLLPKRLSEEVRQDVHTKRYSKELKPNDRDAWHTYVQFEKTMGTGVKAGIKEYLDDKIMRDDLPYSIEPIPVIRPGHTSHWDHKLVKKLGKLGRLEELQEEDLWQ